jgi:hypothetical protein
VPKKPFGCSLLSFNLSVTEKRTEESKMVVNKRCYRERKLIARL